LWSKDDRDWGRLIGDWLWRGKVGVALPSCLGWGQPNVPSGNATNVKGHNFLYTADDKWLPRFDLLFQHYLGNFFRYLNSSLMNISSALFQRLSLD